MNSPKRFGFYSEQQAKLIGTVVYSTPGGGEVEVTEVTGGDGLKPQGSFWGDSQPRGEVVLYLRRGTIGSEGFLRGLK